MDTEDGYRLYETARVRGGLTVQELWLRYLALGGNHDAFDIEGYLQGLLPLEKSQEHVLAVALNERLEEVHRAALIPLPTAPPHEAEGDARRAVINELLGWDASRPRPSDRPD
jgi:hypothetical protein